MANNGLMTAEVSIYALLSRYLNSSRLSYRAREWGVMEVSRMTVSTLSRQLARARACERRQERRIMLGRVGERLGLMHSLAISGENLIGLRALLRTELHAIDVEFWRTQQGELFERMESWR